MIDLIAIVLSGLAVLLSGFALRASNVANRTAIFDRRFEVYTDAELFLKAWMHEARPNMGELARLIGAWSRSQFLFDEAVTRYLRQMWLDAVDADLAAKIAEGRAGGDHAKAVQQQHDLLRKYIDFDGVRGVFLREMKV